MIDRSAASISRSIVLVGLMGAGKSTVGRRLAEHLGVDFFDSDDEIVKAAAMSIPEIFEKFGEQYFRDGEKRVIARLLSQEPCVLATGGGAFMSEEIRMLIAENGVSVWIEADLETLWDRVRDKPGRPLLEAPDPKGTLNALIETRYPVYETANVTVQSARGYPHDAVVAGIVNGLTAGGYLNKTEEKE